MGLKQKSLTLRLPEETYREVQLKKGGTITGYILEALEEKIQRDRDKEISEGFACLAGEIDRETELWLGAQKQAMKHAD